MTANRTTLFVVGGALVLFAAVVLAKPATQSASQPASADWPQWRGPNRDGVALNSPKLLDAWPKEGPKLLWKSDTIPGVGYGGDANGGESSIVVSGGKAFVFVNSKKQFGKIMITTQMLKDYGWEEGVPDDLAMKIEDARLSDKRKDLSGAALDAYIKDFLASVDPELAKKFEAHIKFRLTQGREALSWKEDFAHLAKARDKEFSSFNKLSDAVGGAFYAGTHGCPGSKFMLPLFVMPFEAKTFSFTDGIICLDAKTGKEMWKKEFPGVCPPRSDSRFMASGTPAIVDGKCYASGSAGLYCLSVTDGAVIWQAKTSFTHCSPLVANGKVFLLEQGANVLLKEPFPRGLSAFDAETGKLLWHQSAVGPANGAGGSGGSAMVWTHDRKNYLICLSSGTAHCIDPDTGKELWSLIGGNDGYGSYAGHSTPVIVGDIAVVQGNRAFKMTPEKAEMLWVNKEFHEHCASPIVYQGHIYWFVEKGTCLELATGKIVWSEKDPRGGAYARCYTSLWVDGNKMIAFAWRGYHSEVSLIKVTPDKFEDVGAFTLRELSFNSSPAVADGKLYLRCATCVACYDLTEAGNKPSATTSPEKP